MTGMVSGGMAVQSQPVADHAAGGTLPRAPLSAMEFSLFAQFGSHRRLAADEVLYRRGDVSTSMYVIVSGAVCLDFGAGITPRQLGSGDFFGELGMLMDRHARSHEARANCDTLLIELTPEGFSQLVDQDPAMMVFFLRRTLARVVYSEQCLISQLSRRNHELETALGNLYSTTHELDHTRSLVYSDDLTGLHNRRSLTAYLHRSHRSEGRPQGLLLIDCDDFKGLNDRHGHLAGDQALQCMGRILNSVVGRDDIACRLGGDEFCILLRQADRERLSRVAAFVLDAVGNLASFPGGVPGAHSVSIGMTLIGEQLHWNEAYSLADRALYRAKRQGGGHAEWPPAESDRAPAA